MTQGDRPNPPRHLVPNPAWATSAVARAWELMADSVPPAYLPVLDSVKATSAEDLTGQIHKYGCGKYGCVFQTNDPNVVLKVTTDVTEAEFAAHLAGTLVRPVCVHYFSVISMNMKHQGRPVYLLWRESANHVGTLWKVLGRDADEMVALQHKAAHQAFEYLRAFSQGEVDDQRVVTSAISAWLRECENMARQTRVPQLRELGDGLVEVYAKQRILFGDIHAGNLGIVHRADGGHWVVTDPGHVAVVDL